MQSVRDAVIAGRYRIEHLLGVGGMGTVYRAVDLELDEPVALKLLRRELAAMPGMLDRFRREVKLARRVTHPNVARTFDIGEHDGDRFLTMELIEGESLGSLLEREPRLPLARVVEIATAMCAGLSAAHAAGVVHRDLKPDNVLLGRDGRVVITDFGIARAAVPDPGERRTQGFAVGTPDYMAPEQLEARPDIDGRADVYALGVMLFEMVVGERPFLGDSAIGVAARRLVEEPPDPRSKAAVPDAVARLVLRCLSRRREDRPKSAHEVAQALGSLTLPAELAPPRPSAMPPRMHRATRVTLLPVDAPRSSTTGAFSLLDGVRDLVASLLVAVPGVAARAPSSADGGGDGVAHLVVDMQPDGDDVLVSIMQTRDRLVLFRGRVSKPEIDPFATAEIVAREVARVVGGSPPLWPAPRPTDHTAVELLLRGRADARKPDRDANDRAIARFEQAIAIAPDDGWINASYALALARRFVEHETEIVDAHEAEYMARRALETAPRLVDAIAARALCSDELGDSIEAATLVRRGLALEPGREDLQRLHARLVARTGEGEPELPWWTLGRSRTSLLRSDGVRGRLARALALEAYAFASVQELDRAERKLADAVSNGFDDVAFIDRAKALDPLRTRPSFAGLRAIVAARADALRRTLLAAQETVAA